MPTIAKGFRTEELVREYFLAAGFFVIRGIKLHYQATELTDIDLWVYERSATLARRRTIIDIKDKQKPQAAERLFFVAGLAKVIGVESSGVATTDKNPRLRELAQKNKIMWIDGEDLQRLKSSEKLTNSPRAPEEEFNAWVDKIDKDRGGRWARNGVESMKAAMAERFGASSANTALDFFRAFALDVVRTHPHSNAAYILTRLAYLSASYFAAAFDFYNADFALRPFKERTERIAGAIRLGESAHRQQELLRLVDQAVTEYLPNGASHAALIRQRLTADMDALPAEELADVLAKLSGSAGLFQAATFLESAAYRQVPVGFDHLPLEAKALVGALLDFSGIDRKLFANSAPGDAGSSEEKSDSDISSDPTVSRETSGSAEVVQSSFPLDIPKP